MRSSASRSPAALSLRNWEPIISGASKAIRAASWSGRKSGCRSVFFPPEYDTGWLKEHGRLVRWRIQRVSVSPEEAGLCGCWQFLAVWRERQELRAGKVVEQSEEYSFYCTSAAPKQYSAQQLLQSSVEPSNLPTEHRPSHASIIILQSNRCF